MDHDGYWTLTQCQMCVSSSPPQLIVPTVAILLSNPLDFQTVVHSWKGAVSFGGGGGIVRIRKRVIIAGTWVSRVAIYPCINFHREFIWLCGLSGNWRLARQCCVCGRIGNGAHWNRKRKFGTSEDIFFLLAKLSTFAFVDDCHYARRWAGDCFIGRGLSFSNLYPRGQ